MQHEMSGLEFELEHQGYRVDGEHGIKNVVKLPQRKSVDYFYQKQHRCIFIEFSDLTRGREDLLGLEQTIDEMDNSFHANALKKLLKAATRDEMATKFKDSIAIFDRLRANYHDCPEAFLKNDAKVFYIVYAPVNASLPDHDKAEITRFISNLGSRVSGLLEDEICDRVKMVQLENLPASL
jgi:hypothetical protein